MRKHLNVVLHNILLMITTFYAKSLFSIELLVHCNQLTIGNFSCQQKRSVRKKNSGREVFFNYIIIFNEEL